MILRILILLLLLMPGNALALPIAWDANPEGTLGYVIYWQEQGTTDEFRALIPSRTITTYIIEDRYLKISTTQNPVIYDIWAKAYDDQGISDSSEVITAEREYTFSPPASNLPTVIYEPTKPTKIIINVTP